jgi:nucleoside phosphorylase
MSNGTPDAGTIDLGIIVALTEEFRELHAYLPSATSIRDEPTGITDYLFELPVQSGAPYRCAATFIDDMGPTEAALATDRFLSRRHPGTMVMLGIAAGIDGFIKLGDVVVAKHVGCYLNRARIDPGQAKTFDICPGGESFPCTAPLTKIAANLEFASDGIYRTWQTSSGADLTELVPEATRRKKLLKKGWLDARPQLVTGQIASGPVVAASREFVEWVLSVNRKYVALEMEAGGMLSAMYSSGLPARSLVLRGVSDFGDQRKAELDQVGSGGLRKYAMRNTVRLLWSLLSAGAIPRVEAGAPPKALAPPALRRKPVARVEPARSTITLQDFFQFGLFSEFVERVRTAANALSILEEVGYPRAGRPQFPANNEDTTPFWQQIVHDIDGGVLPSGRDLQPLVDAAHHLYPSNALFARHRSDADH